MAGQALSKLSMLPSFQSMREMRLEATVDCVKNETIATDCRPLEKPCLFNVDLDPCEQNNLADKYPEILNEMLKKLAEYNQTALPPANLPLDPNADPRFFDNTWTNFGDFAARK